MSIKSLLKKTTFYKYYSRRKSKKYREHQAHLTEVFLREGREVLKLYSETLKVAGIDFWLDYGTLLGCYREHGFIPHDTDIDTGAFKHDADKIRKALENAGFRLVRWYRTLDGEGIEHCYCREGYSTTIDVFYYEQVGEDVSCYGFYPKDGLRVEKHLRKEIPFTSYKVTTPFKGLVAADFLGLSVNIPKDTVEYLKANYGSNFMTPDPHFKMSSVSNITKYSYEQKPAVGYLEIPY